MSDTGTEYTRPAALTLYASTAAPRVKGRASGPLIMPKTRECQRMGISDRTGKMVHTPSSPSEIHH